MDDTMPRILKDPAIAGAFEVLAERLSGSDLQVFLHALAATRAGPVEPWAVLGQQRLDRFCQASSVDAAVLANVSADALHLAQESRFEPVQLSPLGPLGGAAAVGEVAQNNVLTTMQLCEVVSDPTTALALVAASRRRLLRDTAEVTRVSAVQRVMRAKQFDAPSAMAHFSVFALVSVGRDRGRRRFESEELRRQLRVLVEVINQVQSTGRIRIEISDNSGRREDAEALVEALAGQADTEIGPPRTHASDCYPNLCTKLSWSGRGTTIEIGGGGVTTWPSEFASEHNDRLVVSRLIIDGLVDVGPQRSHGRERAQR